MSHCCCFDSSQSILTVSPGYFYCWLASCIMLQHLHSLVFTSGAGWDQLHAAWTICTTKKQLMIVMITLLLNFSYCCMSNAAVAWLTSWVQMGMHLL